MAGGYGVKYVKKYFTDPEDPQRRSRAHIRCDAFYLDEMDSRHVLLIDDGELTTCTGALGKEDLMAATNNNVKLITVCL